MKEQLSEAWRIANQINLVLIDNMDDTAMQNSLSTRGGRTVYQQLAHLHNVRMQWLEIAAKDLFKKYKTLDKETIDKKLLRKSLEDSANAIEELIRTSWDNGGKVKNFTKGLIPFISYLIAHEAHHRGNIMLTLKQSGVKIPEKLKWEIWDWGKM